MRMAVLAFLLSSVAGVSATQKAAAPAPDPCGPGPIYRSGQPGVRLPEPLTTLKPKYPDTTGHTVQGGPMVFDFVVDHAGRVCEIRQVRSVKFSPPFPEWVEAVRQAIARQTYKPATKDGIAVKFRMTMTVIVDLQ